MSVQRFFARALAPLAVVLVGAILIAATVTDAEARRKRYYPREVEVQVKIERLIALEAFMGRSKDLDWGVQATCRPLAEKVMRVLRERLGLGDGPVPLDVDALRR